MCASPDLGVNGSAMAATARLAIQETIRLTTHPLVLVGIAASLLWSSSYLTNAPDNPFNVYDGLTQLPCLLLGPLTVIAANMVTSRDRRAGTTEVLLTAPISGRRRTCALLLAPAGPTVITVVLVVVQVAVFRGVNIEPSRWPTSAELAIQRVSVLGGGLLGIMLARWTSFPGTAMITLLALFAVYHAFSFLDPNTWLSYAPYRDLRVAGPNATNISYFVGSMGWHLTYVLLLGAIAAIGALLGTPGPKRGLLVMGACAVAGAVFAGWLQLP